MFPVIAAVGSFTISSLGLCIALAFVLGSFEIWKKTKEEHYEDNDIFDIIFLTFFGGLIGGRFFHILYNFSDFGFDVSKWLNLGYNNEIAWLGFLFGVMYVLFLVYKRKKFNYFEFLDLAVFGIIVAQILVRIGQFLDGSYLGSVTQLPVGLHFPGVNGARYPIQLIEIVFLMFLFYLLKWLSKHYRLFSWYQDSRGKAHSGFLWLTYVASICLFYLLLDFITARQTIFWLISIGQIVTLVMFVVALLLFWLRAGNKLSMPFLAGILAGNVQTPIRKPLQSLIHRRRRFVRNSRTKVGTPV